MLFTANVVKMEIIAIKMCRRVHFIVEFYRIYVHLNASNIKRRPSRLAQRLQLIFSFYSVHKHVLVLTGMTGTTRIHPFTKTILLISIRLVVRSLHLTRLFPSSFLFMCTSTSTSPFHRCLADRRILFFIFFFLDCSFDQCRYMNISEHLRVQTK